jgi:hypothetical protein
MHRHRIGNRVGVRRIACINAATVELGVDFDKLISALQKFLDKCFVPVWGTPATLVKARRPLRGAWTLVFLDEAESEENGYHALASMTGLPQAKVFENQPLKSEIRSA